MCDSFFSVSIKHAGLFFVCVCVCTCTIVGVSLIGCTSEKKVEIHQMFCSWVDLVVKI